MMPQKGRRTKIDLSKKRADFIKIQVAWFFSPPCWYFLFFSRPPTKQDKMASCFSLATVAGLQFSRDGSVQGARQEALMAT